MLWTVMNKSWKQHPTKQQLYDHIPSISKTIKVRRIRYAGRCCRSKAELITNVLLWTPSLGWASVGWPARIYLQQLCVDIECGLEDMPEAMDDRRVTRETEKSVLAARHDDDDDDTSLKNCPPPCHMLLVAKEFGKYIHSMSFGRQFQRVKRIKKKFLESIRENLF